MALSSTDMLPSVEQVVQAETPQPFDPKAALVDPVFSRAHIHLRTRLLYKMRVFDLFGREGILSPSLAELPDNSPDAFITKGSFNHLTGGDLSKPLTKQSFRLRYDAYNFENASEGQPVTQVGPAPLTLIQLL